MFWLFLIAALSAALFVQLGAASVWVVVLSRILKALTGVVLVTASLIGALYLRRRRRGICKLPPA